MSLPVKTGLPLGLELPNGYTIRWRAVDPTSGADVSGVVISDVAVQASPLGGTAVPADTGLYELIPGPVDESGTVTV